MKLLLKVRIFHVKASRAMEHCGCCGCNQVAARELQPRRNMKRMSGSVYSFHFCKAAMNQACEAVASHTCGQAWGHFNDQFLLSGFSSRLAKPLG